MWVCFLWISTKSCEAHLTDLTHHDSLADSVGLRLVSTGCPSAMIASVCSISSCPIKLSTLYVHTLLSCVVHLRGWRCDRSVTERLTKKKNLNGLECTCVRGGQLCEAMCVSVSDHLGCWSA